jgi:hypothetical protein
MARKTVQSPKYLVTSSAVVPSDNTFQPNSWFTWLSIWNHSTANRPFCSRSVPSGGPKCFQSVPPTSGRPSHYGNGSCPELNISEGALGTKVALFVTRGGAV